MLTPWASRGSRRAIIVQQGDAALLHVVFRRDTLQLAGSQVLITMPRRARRRRQALLVVSVARTLQAAWLAG